MSDFGIIRWLRELDENGAVALARALIHAEAGRLGLPLDGFTMSGRVKARDEGIDGRTSFPSSEQGLLLPPGYCVWQVKSGETAPSARREFDEQKRARLREEIAQGADYVLFWANDPTDRQATPVRDAFRAEIRAVRPDAEAHFLFGEAIERLCLAHLGVLAHQSPIPLGGVVSLDVWAASETFRAIAFQADHAREGFVEVLRQHVQSEDASPAEVHVIGDAGVGKSRSVYEALAVPGIAERVLVAPDSASLNHALLSLVAQWPERRLVLVVDDCEPEDRMVLARFAGMARGRLRLITVGSRTQRTGSSGDLRYIELGPLATPANREIALSVGLDERDADMVAEYTEGYPGLALTLASAIKHSTAPASLIDRVRGHEEIGSVLSSLLPGDDVSPLGMLSLFERLGFDADLAPELTLACETLGVNESQLRQIANRELNRFVSTAGRYRRVTPKLFALWLASRFIDEHTGTLRTALTNLPGSLRERILDQMRGFAGDPAVADALAGILDAPPFTDGALGDVGEGATRLLHVAAIAAPTAAMGAIDRLLAGLSTDELRAIRAPRRDLVWALEALVWFDELFDRAADALLRLAIAENETWANNATGVIQGLFRVHLGGTAAPYDQRIAWARHALAAHGEPTVPLLIEGLQNAFEAYESRTSTDFGGRAGPAEWRPTTVADEIAAREAAWDLLLQIARDHPGERDTVATAIAAGLRMAVRRGLSQRVLDDVGGFDWSPDARGAIGEAISNALYYDEPPEPLAAQLAELRASLRGSNIADRLAYALTQPPWDLTHDPDEIKSGRPTLLIDLARELAESGDDSLIDAARQSRVGDQQTVGLLFEEVARLRAEDQVLSLLEAEEPLPTPAVLGAIRGLASIRDDTWSDGVLARWLDSPRLAGLVTAAVHFLPATAERAALAVSAVDRGAAVPLDLGRFLYGAWARALPEESLVEILTRLQAAPEPQAIENALGILTQWLDDHQGESRSPALAATALDLLDRASSLTHRRSAMVGLYRSRAVRMLALEYDAQFRVLINTLRGLDTFLDTYDLELIDAVTEANPRRTVEGVLRELADDGSGFRPWVMWAGNATLLSRLARTAGSDVVKAALLEIIPPDQWRSIVRHFDFTNGPDEVVAELIERSDDDVFLARAAWHFSFPETVWMGSQADHLRARRKVAEQRHQEADPRSRVHGWLDSLLGELDAQIAASEQEEAERGF
jgi:hypothetical protein